MALQKTITLPNGLVATDAYHKITLMSVYAEGTNCSASVTISTYLDEAASLEKPPIICNTYPVQTFDKANEANIAGLMYAWLKTLPEYDGAIDV
jgi:hypothetical protein